MHLREMRLREDFEAILCQTLSQDWSCQLSTAVEVVPDRLHGRCRPGQHWQLSTLFSAYFHGPASAEVRRYLGDSLRHTPRLARAPGQWLLAGWASSPLGLALGAGPGFRVWPALYGAAHTLVVPGNQRLRVFDFARSRVRVVLKKGFARQTMDNELAVRTGAHPPPTLPLLAVDRSAPWFEEPIFEGWALPRCPPWLPRQDLARQVLDALGAWAHARRTMREAPGYVGELLGEILITDRALRARGLAPGLPVQGLTRAIQTLAQSARGLEDVVIAPSHGDLQPGNILVGRHGQPVVLIDWEHGGPRSLHYDQLVLELGTRSAQGLVRRLARWLATGRTRGPGPALDGSPAWRRHYAALFLLEDLLWFYRESTTGPFGAISQGLGLYLEQLPELARLCGDAP